jgi:2-hydroxy-3-oxopropionate reductase
VAEAARGADVVLTMLPDSPDVEEVVLGRRGVLESAKAGTLLIDASTVRPAVSIRVAKVAMEHGLRAVDAPVSGGERGAIEGTLSIMVGGEEADVTAARPILQAVGSIALHVGPAGSGQTVKAANRLIVAGTIRLVAEALVFLEAHGVNTEAAVQVLAGGLAGNRVLDRKSDGMRARASSTLASGSTCTTRISASSPRPHEKSGWPSH